MTTKRSSGEMLKLEDAVRYPGAGRRAVLVTVVGIVFIVAAALATPSVSPFLWSVAGMAFMFGTVALAIRRDNHLMAPAAQIFQDHPEYTAQEAANAARKELGRDEVRYP